MSDLLFTERNRFHQSFLVSYLDMNMKEDLLWHGPPTSKETAQLAIPACITARASHVLWCISGSLTHGGGENVPGIPGACANCNSTYLVRGPWNFISLVIFTPCPLNVPKHWGLLMVISSKLYIALKKQQFIREIRIHMYSFPRKKIFRALNKKLYFDISSEFCGNHICPRLRWNRENIFPRVKYNAF